MANFPADMPLDQIEVRLSELTLLRDQRLAEAESKKSKKDKKKSAKIDVKVPKVTCQSK
jgi:hypothetical protein